MTLAVIIPNFNHGQYLAQSVLSVMEQSRPPDEVIIVDDGSTDGSELVAESLASKFELIRVVRNDRNLGIHATIERGLEECSSDHLYFLAADDVALPGFFSEAMSLLKRHPEAGLCAGFQGDLDKITGEPVLKGKPRWVPGETGFYGPRDLSELVPRGLAIGANFAIVNREAFLNVGGFRSDLGGLQDWFTMMAVAFRRGACLISRPVAAIRWSPNGQFLGPSTRERIQWMRRILTLLESREFEDVRWLFRRGAFNLGGWEFFLLLVASPSLWKWASLPYLRLRVRCAPSTPSNLFKLLRH